MSGVKVEVRLDNSDEYRSITKHRIAVALEAVGIQAEGYAKALCPVDTGRLRASITHQVDGGQTSVAIGTNVEYGVYNELGTSRRGAANGGRGFLRPAVTDNLDVYRAILTKYLTGA